MIAATIHIRLDDVSALRKSSSSDTRVLNAHVASAPKARASAKREILDLLDQTRPQSHVAMASVI